MTTVLVTGAGTAAAQGVMKALGRQREREVRLVAVDANPRNAGRFLAHAFRAVPRCEHSDYLAALLDVVRSERVEALFPVLQSELLPLARAKADFRSAGCAVVVADPPALETCLDKLALHAFLNRLGIPTPETLPAADWLRERGANAWPAMVKPRRGTGSRGNRRVADAAEFEAAVREIGDAVAQPCLAGVEHSVDVLGDLEGRPVAAVARTREAMRDGAAVSGVTVREPALCATAQRIAAALPLVGFGNVQCFRTANGAAPVFDVNPRFGGASIHSFAAGMNAPLLLLENLAGREIGEAARDYRAGLRMYRYWEEFFAEEPADASGS